VWFFWSCIKFAGEDFNLPHDPLHGGPEGRFFGGCLRLLRLLPLYVSYGGRLLSQAAPGEYRCCCQQTPNCWPHKRVENEPSAASPAAGCTYFAVAGMLCRSVNLPMRL
jgi:hypothetical protein